MKLLVISKGVAVYQAELFEHINKNLSDDSSVTVYHVNSLIGMGGWKGLEQLETYEIEFEHVKVAEKSGLLVSIFRKFFSVHSKAMTFAPQALCEKVLECDTLWVHEINEFTIMPILLAKMHCKKVVLSTEVGMDKTGVKLNWSTYLTHWLFSSLFSGLAARSIASMQYSLSEKIPKIFAPYVVDISQFTPAQAGQGKMITFIFVGQYIHRKGIDLLFKSCELLAKKGIENYKIKLVGKGDESMVGGLIATHSMSEKVQNVGFCYPADLPKHYNSSDVFILPTREDTHAVVVHEAAACGLPLIVSKYAGASSVFVEEGKNGFIVDPYDSSQMAERMERMIMKDVDVSKMGARSREIAEKWSNEEQGVKVANFLTDLI